MARRFLFFLLASLLVVPATEARADDGASALRAARSTPDEPAAETTGLRGPRIGVTPGIGAGVAAFTAQPAAFPSFVGTSISQIEGLFELERWGFFARGGYLSSGQSGRWTAPEFALGAQYRLSGDGETRWGVVARVGVIYQRWSASTAGCDITLFIPQNCKDLALAPVGAGGTNTGPTPTPPFKTTVDTLGLLAAMRFEAPVQPIYVALGAELAALPDIDSASPGVAFTGQLTLTFALRDHVGSTTARTQTTPVRPFNRRY